MAEWVEITEGCRMPEENEEVLLAVLLTEAMFGPDDVTIIEAAQLSNGVFTGNRNWYGPEFEERSMGDKVISRVLAWMPAPKPFVKGQA